MKTKKTTIEIPEDENIKKTTKNKKEKKIIEKNEDSSESENNKGNGYYERIVKYLEKYLRIKIPRDRNAEFKSELLEYLRKEKEKMDQLAFKLYVKGLTTRDIEYKRIDVTWDAIHLRKKLELTSLLYIN